MVEYLMDAEGRHYEEAEQDERENHIYRSVLAVARWMRGYNDHE